MTVEQHLEWAKARADQFLDDGDPANAVASFASDISKHAAIARCPTVQRLIPEGVQIVLRAVARRSSPEVHVRAWMHNVSSFARMESAA